MGNRYVDTTITRQTQPVSQVGFGTALLLTDTAHAYKEYADIAAVAVDFAAGTTTYKKAAAYFGQDNKPTKLAIYGVAYDEGTDAPSELADALNALLLTNSDWYYLLTVHETKAEIEALDDWAATQQRIYVAVTQDQTVAATGDNTFVMVSDVADNHLDAAVVGYIAPLEIGSYTVQFSKLKGVNACSSFDTTEINAIHAKNYATFIREGGVNIVSAGKAASGEFLDVIQSSHYINARMTENVFRLLTTSPKVPYTNGGIALVVAEVEATLKDAFNNGIIAEENGAPMFSVTAPTRAEVPANDRANRTLPDVRWTATIAGAIHNVTIAGTLQV